MIAMRNYKVIISENASSDLDAMAKYISTLYRVESGHNYVNRILGQLASLSYTADIYQYSKFVIARKIHPFAKTLSIMNRKWTVVFHIESDYVMVDRFIPSKLMY